MGEQHLENLETINAVRCSQCNKLHDVNDTSFIAIHGNVTLGLKGGLIGNNFDEEGRVKKVSVFCMGDCLRKLFDILQRSDDKPKTTRKMTNLETLEAMSRKAKEDKAAAKDKEDKEGTMTDMRPPHNPIHHRRNTFPPLIPPSSPFLDGASNPGIR